MADLLTTAYPWVKSAHVIAAVAWMAGLLYLPRLFVYHAERGVAGSELSETFKVMERRLVRFIMTPAMITAWVMGVILVFTPGVVDPIASHWFQIKLAALIALTYCHYWLEKRRREFVADLNIRPARTYRFVNEIPTVLMIIIIVMVIARPFS